MFGFRRTPGRKRPVFFYLALVIAWAAAAWLPDHAREASAHNHPTDIQPARVAALPRIALLVGNQRLTAEVATDDTSRSRGLMFRKELEPDHGMLFVFAEPAQLCFWMKNTPLPLTVAFIDAAGSIVNLADMQPHSLDPHCAIAPALYALEAEQGWFARYGITPGTRVRGLPRLQRRQSE